MNPPRSLFMEVTFRLFINRLTKVVSSNIGEEMPKEFIKEIVALGLVGDMGCLSLRPARTEIGPLS